MALLVHGLTDKHKDFLYAYAQEKLGSRSRTKAILALINEKMTNDQVMNKQPIQQENLTSNKKVRIQFSLREHDYNLLCEIVKNTDSSIQHYIISVILNLLYDDKVRLLGNEIEQLKKSNYELHKIGVNINQIAKAINAGEKDKVGIDLNNIYDSIESHIEIVKTILAKNTKRY